MGSHRVGHDWSDLAAAAAIITTVHILFVLTFFSLWHSNYMPLTLLGIVLQLLNVIFQFSCLPFFLFAFHVANFLLTYIQAHWFFFFFSHAESTDEPIKGILHFCYCFFFKFLWLPFDSLFEFLSLCCILHLFLPVVYLFHYSS